ncbi:MAG: asparagine synthase (glutamine-hydrolyzing) [Ectothiorhodospiraceae bacterium]|nr:asparagine synthase (glutamine-hydrolyzing) [Ectothiorhodospiraceae bacterium]
MCGLAGIFAYHPAAPPPAPLEVARIRDAMARRGPHGQGLHVADDGRLQLGHRRLAIVDPSPAGDQPMTDPGGTVVIAHVGEIYNRRRLAAELEAAGTRLRGSSDTEVLLHLYLAHGEGMLERLRGMFAFAIWDGRSQRLLLARDPYGIKPLYYADDGWTLRFATQARALVDTGAVSAARDPAGQAGFLLLGSVPEPFTLYRDVRALPAGSAMWVDRHGPRPPRTWSRLADAVAEAEALAASAPPPAEEARARMREALLDSVRHHLESDRPVGVFLSAGVDSGALLGLATEVAGHSLDAFTVRFPELAGAPEDETAGAARTAARYGARHHVVEIGASQAGRALDQALAAMDQPTIDGLNTWLVADAARDHGLHVALSGTGGDELLGGYPAFRSVPARRRWLALAALIPGLGVTARELLRRLPLQRLGVSPKAAGLAELGGDWAGGWLLARGLFMPWELPALLGREAAREGLDRLRPLTLVRSVLGAGPDGGPRTDFGRVAVLESSLYLRHQLLRDADWAGMDRGVEVRVPLVDPVLLRAVVPLLARAPLGSGKRWLAAAARPALEPALAAAPKTGFTVPMAAWLAGVARDRLGAWRSMPELARPGCHWARRLAWAIHAEGLAAPPGVALGRAG